MFLIVTVDLNDVPLSIEIINLKLVKSLSGLTTSPIASLIKKNFVHRLTTKIGKS